MVERLRNELHHWWPRSLSKFWADSTGHVHRVSPDGELIRSLPQQFGAIRNDNNIIAGETPSPWDHSFEETYSKADNAFPGLIEWLHTLTSPINATDAPLPQRLSPLIIENRQRELLAECLASLISRSPNFRNRIRLTTEYYREQFGLRDPTAPKNLIGINVKGTQKSFSEAIKRGGKFAVLLAGEEEFIFGDGFLHNFSMADRPHNPRCLVPITPDIAIFHIHPMRYRSFPQAFVVNLSPKEVSLINWATQVYAKRFLFFREIHPVINDAFTEDHHLEVEYHKHPWLEGLQAAMADTFFGHDALFYPADHQPRR